MGKQLKKMFGGRRAPARNDDPALQEGLGGLGGNAFGISMLGAAQETQFPMDNPMLAMAMGAHDEPSQAQVDPGFIEPLYDPRAQADQTISDKLGDKLGKHRDDEEFAGIIQGLAGIEDQTLPMFTRLRNAPRVIEAMERWLADTARPKSRRA